MTGHPCIVSLFLVLGGIPGAMRIGLPSAVPPCVSSRHLFVQKSPNSSEVQAPCHPTPMGVWAASVRACTESLKPLGPRSPT